jgi:hypothetical protein
MSLPALRESPVMALTREEYDRQVERQRKAIADLRGGGSLLHAIARAYYLVYVTASFVATHHGVEVTHSRGGKEVIDRDWKRPFGIDPFSASRI